MAVNFVDPLPQLVGRDFPKVTDLGIALHSLFQTSRERIGVRFDQTH
jgi:hypothetical protein